MPTQSFDSGSAEDVKPKGSRRRATKQQEGFARLMIAKMREIANEGRAKTGTVVGSGDNKGGGGLRVKMDHEASERTVHLPRELGRGYRNGDRIKLTPMENGEEWVSGPYSTASGKSGQGVRDDDLEDNAVNEDKIPAGAIGKGGKKHIAGGAIGKNEVGSRQLGNAHFSDDANDRLAASKIGDGLDFGQLNQTTQKRITDALTSIPGSYIQREELNTKFNSIDLSAYVKSTQLADGTTGTKVAKDKELQDLKTAFNKLKTQVDNMKTDKKEKPSTKDDK